MPIDATTPGEPRRPNPSAGSAFAATRWTLVQRARGETPEARVALAELCEAYWQPVFRFIAGEGRDEDGARELTQEFFARLLAGGGVDSADRERGRFRSYLLGAVKHFLADVRDRERRLKRGGGLTPESLDAPGTAAGDTAPGLQVPDPRAPVPDTVFDRQWAMAILARSLAALRAEFAADGRDAWFETLKPWLLGDVASLSQAEAGGQLGLTEGAIKVAIHRLRRRLRERVRAEVAQTVAGTADVDEELRYLVEVLASVA